MVCSSLLEWRQTAELRSGGPGLRRTVPEQDRQDKITRADLQYKNRMTKYDPENIMLSYIELSDLFQTLLTH